VRLLNAIIINVLIVILQTMFVVMCGEWNWQLLNQLLLIEKFIEIRVMVPPSRVRIISFGLEDHFKQEMFRGVNRAPNFKAHLKKPQPSPLN